MTHFSEHIPPALIPGLYKSAVATRGGHCSMTLMSANICVQLTLQLKTQTAIDFLFPNGCQLFFFISMIEQSV